MRRREFISLIAGATTWPLAARAQQAGKPPIIGVISVGTVASTRPFAQFDSEHIPVPSSFFDQAIVSKDVRF
jgi:hypothetical protein